MSRRANLLQGIKDFQSIREAVQAPVIDLCIVEFLSVWLNLKHFCQMLQSSNLSQGFLQLVFYKCDYIQIL